MFTLIRYFCPANKSTASNKLKCRGVPNEFHERIARFRKRVYYLGPGRSTGAQLRRKGNHRLPSMLSRVLRMPVSYGEKERTSSAKSTMENCNSTRVFSLSTARTSGFRAPLLCPVTNTRTRLFPPSDRPFDQSPLLQRAFHFQTSFRVNRRSFAVA